MSLSQALRRRRKELGLGVDVIAERAGVSHMTIRSVEAQLSNSRQDMSHTLSTYARIARVLGARIEWRLVDERTGEEVQ